MSDLQEALRFYLPVQLRGGQVQSRTREQGPNVLQRDVLFRVMAMLRDAKGMLSGLLPEGTEGAIRQAQKSIESAHWKLNSVSSKFQESVQKVKISWSQGAGAVQRGTAPGFPGWQFVVVKVGSAVKGRIVNPDGKEFNFQGFRDLDTLKGKMLAWFNERV